MNFEQPQQENSVEILGMRFKYDDDGMVKFGDVARGLLNQQCQYASEYVTGIGNSPTFADDLRISGDKTFYHGLKIHKDDIVTFVNRVQEYRIERGL